MRRTVEEAWNNGSLAVLDELTAANYVGHDPANHNAGRGPDAEKQMVSTYRTAFPDLEIIIDDMVAEGDKVATRWTARGTHKGDLMGIASTGKQGTTTGISIDRIVGGKVEEAWTNWDLLGIMQQLGAVPEMATARA